MCLKISYLKNLRKILNNVILIQSEEDQCSSSNTYSQCYDLWKSCCPGGDGPGYFGRWYVDCSLSDCSDPGVIPCEGAWMAQNCEAICNPCPGIIFINYI